MRDKCLNNIDKPDSTPAFCINACREEEESGRECSISPPPKQGNRSNRSVLVAKSTFESKVVSPKRGGPGARCPVPIGPHPQHHHQRLRAPRCWPCPRRRAALPPTTMAVEKRSKGKPVPRPKGAGKAKKQQPGLVDRYGKVGLAVLAVGGRTRQRASRSSHSHAAAHLLPTLLCSMLVLSPTFGPCFPTQSGAPRNKSSWSAMFFYAIKSCVSRAKCFASAEKKRKKQAKKKTNPGKLREEKRKNKKRKEKKKGGKFGDHHHPYQRGLPSPASPASSRRHPKKDGQEE